MNRESRDLCLSQAATDFQHDPAGVASPLAFPPLMKLVGKIGWRLSAESRIGRSSPFAVEPMAIGAGSKPAPGIARRPERWRRAGPGWRRGEAHCSIMSGNGLAVDRLQLRGEIFHLGMLSKALGIGLHLPVEVAEIEAGQPRCAGAIAEAVEAVTGGAGEAGAAISATQCNQLSRFQEAIGSCPFDGGAAAGGDEQGGQQHPLLPKTASRGH